uniref:Endonuclease domain-containing protein n=1 Tax=Vibrio ziniensis TaxID=2711221 RepID=A0A6G7CMG9_9VIBR|nr:endonuclease domain-containing protein [Vibrio ziniensis]
MNKIFNTSRHKKLRQILRNHMPEPELRLWARIRSNQLGVKFRRQHGIDGYIVDFYCPHKKVVIEIDGDSHYSSDAMVNDLARDQYLISLGLRVLRFTNQQVMTELESVVEVIVATIGKENPL